MNSADNAAKNLDFIVFLPFVEKMIDESPGQVSQAGCRPGAFLIDLSARQNKI
jgi:hypothetical protein